MGMRILFSKGGPMRVACVATKGFEDAELMEPKRAMEAAGHEVDVIAPHEGEIAGYHERVRVQADVSIDEAEADDYDALFVPGGYSPDQLRADDRYIRFVRKFEGRPIFAICHGAQLLFTAGLLEGRRVTAWRTVQHDLSRAGVDVVDEPVVVDEKLVTGRQPGDLPQFNAAILRVLGEGPVREVPGEVHAPGP
jgi:protease I